MSEPTAIEPAGLGADEKARSRLALAIAAGVAIGSVVATVLLVSGPRPDAILPPSGVAPDEGLITMMQSEGIELGLPNPAGFASEMGIDLSTLRGFGDYRGIELWSAVNEFESPCLIAVHRESADIIGRRCVPKGVELFVETMWHGLPGGERLRFHLRGDRVAAYLLAPDGAS
jgi:hypothetical protein